MRSGFRVLIRLYPRAFRERWDRELIAFLSDEWRDARGAGGRLWRVRFWARAVADAAAAGLRLRLRVGRDHGSGRRGRARMGTLWTELGLAMRAFARAPGFHLFAALTVALGVAGVTAAFGVLDGVVLRPLPYPESARLVRVAASLSLNPGNPGPMSEGAVAAIASRSRVFDAVTLLEVRSRVQHGEGGSELARVAGAGPGLFELLGARAARGRLFAEADHAAGAAPVAVLAWRTWATRFGGDPEVLGRTVRIDDGSYAVVGVLDRSFVPPEAAGATDVEYWTNVSIDPANTGRMGAFSIGRLRPGATVAQAEVEASAILRELYAVDGATSFVEGARVLGLKEATIGSLGGTLWLVLGGVGLLLAIACANVANLMLARGSDRRGDAVLRVVLGASRARVVLQQLAHSLVVAAAGGLAGALLAAGALGLLRRFTPGDIPRLSEVSVDARVLGFSIVLSAGAGLVFGILPALQACRRAPADLLRDSPRTMTARSGARGALVALETGMAVVLVLVSGLLLNGFLRLRSVDPGFDTDRLAALKVELDGRDEDATRAYFDRLLATVRSLPGVRSAALSAFVPYGGYALIKPYTVDAASGSEVSFLPAVLVSDDWVRTMGVRIVAGRDFDAAERAGEAPVVLVSEALARSSWPGEPNVIGRRIRAGAPEAGDQPWYTVVGVVSDVRNRADDAPARLVYHPHTHDSSTGLAVLIRMDDDAAAVLPAVRRAVSVVDAAVPIRTLDTVNDLASASISAPRFYTAMIAGFGVVALILAVVGIYGTTAYATSRRTREIGVRLALGGAPSAVAGRLVRDGVRHALIGTALGMACALAAGRLIESHLFGVRSTDPPTFVVTAITVLMTATCAAYLPARRAIRIGPTAALRGDAPGSAP